MMAERQTAQAYIDQHNLRAVLDNLIQPIVKRRDPHPLEALAVEAPFVSAGTPASATALMSAGSVSPSDLASLEFDVFSYCTPNKASASPSPPASPSSYGVLHAFVQKIFEAHGLLSHFKIDAPSFLQWVATVEANYHSENSFHNFLHAFNVLQTANVFITCLQKETGNAITKVEVFALLVAALCHDLQHPGVTNQFLTITNHPLALRYNDTSVLESHHAAVTLSLFFGPSTAAKPSILKNFSPDDIAAFRKLVSQFILSTDLAHHKVVVSKLNSYIDSMGTAAKDKVKKILEGNMSGGASNTITVADTESRTILLKAVVKASDLGNEVRSFKFSERWAPLVKEEFYAQGDAQRKLGHTGGVGGKISVSCDRLDEKSMMYYDQPSFIEFLCLPLFDALEKISPTAFAIAAGNLKANNGRWKAQQPGYVGSPVSARSQASFGGPAAAGGSSGLAGSATPSRIQSMVPPDESEDDEEEYEDDEEL